MRTNAKKVAGSRTCRHQRKFLKCDGAKARKSDDQDVIRFSPLFGLKIAHDLHFRAQIQRNMSPFTCDAPLPIQERVSQIRFELLVKKKATNEEGNDITRKVGTRFSYLVRIKDDYVIVMSGVREDKEEDVFPSGPGLSYRSNTTTWLRYRSALSVPYGINYIANSNPCTLLDVLELIHMVNCDLPPSPHN